MSPEGSPTREGGGGLAEAARALLARIRAGAISLEEASRLLLELLRHMEERIRELAWVPSQSDEEDLPDAAKDKEIAARTRLEIFRAAASWMAERLALEASTTARIRLSSGLRREVVLVRSDLPVLVSLAEELLAAPDPPPIPQPRVELEEARRLLLGCLAGVGAVSLASLAAGDRGLLVALFLVALALSAAGEVELVRGGEIRRASGVVDQDVAVGRA